MALSCLFFRLCRVALGACIVGRLYYSIVCLEPVKWFIHEFRAREIYSNGGSARLRTSRICLRTAFNAPLASQQAASHSCSGRFSMRPATRSEGHTSELQSPDHLV